MSYSAVPDRRMPYDTDGTVVAYGPSVAAGISGYYTSTELGHLNDYVDHGQVNGYHPTQWFFFPGEQREVTAAWFGYNYPVSSMTIEGSNDTTNGMDGTWETATHGTIPGGGDQATGDGWRAHIFTISFTGPKAAVRITANPTGGTGDMWHLIHLYGEKASGQTPDDILFLDSDDGGAEFTAVEDFSDRPLGTTVTRQFKIKNGSATKTANSINIQCNDSDFAISTDGVTWVVTINIAALASGASSSTMYVRNTTPSPGGSVGPRHARVTAIVGSWT